jgi:SAM-dependent methyltransferase
MFLRILEKMFNLTNTFIAHAYNKAFKQHGPNPRASFWSSSFRQNLRFEIITNELTKISKNNSVSICDLGCGYGAYCNFLSGKSVPKISNYIGVDLSKEVINYCKNSINYEWATFTRGYQPPYKVDFTILSGTLNYAVTDRVELWEKQVLNCLEKCWEKSCVSLIFNLQVCKNVSWISDDKIYFAEPNRMKEICENKFGKTTYISNTLLPDDGTFVVLR